MNFLSLFKRNFLFKLKKKIDIDKDIFDSNISLEELFKFYNTDKAKYYKQPENLDTEKYNKGHGYADFYDKHFQNMRLKKMNFLEIGSYSGASAAAFSKYFPNAKIFCLDVNLTKFIYKGKNLFPVGIDATNSKMVKKFLKSINFDKNSFFDIIIDDGSHLLSHQLKSLDIFYNLVAPGGYYVIEEYRFCEFLDHLKDTSDPPLSKIIVDIKNNQNPKIKLIKEEILSLIKDNNKNIFEYKGDHKFSYIAFFKK